MTRSKHLSDPSPERPQDDPGHSSALIDGGRGALVVPIRRDGPLELAKQCAVASAPEFLEGPWPAWSWPWRLARRLMSIKGIAQDTDPIALQMPIMAFYESAGIESAARGSYPTAHDFFVGVIAEWSTIRFPEGEGPLEAASRQAELMPVRVAERLSPNFSKLVAIAAHLQEYVGSAEIILPTPRLGALLNVTAQHAGHLLRVAVRLRYLMPVDGTWSYTQHRARTFRYIGPRPRKE